MATNYLTYYELLKVGTNASSNEILKAYKARALEYHPDKNGGHPSATLLFQMIQEAKDVLTDPHKRLEYDYSINIRKRPGQQNYYTQQEYQQTNYNTRYTQRQPRQAEPEEQEEAVKETNGWDIARQVIGGIFSFLLLIILLGNSNN